VSGAVQATVLVPVRNEGRWLRDTAEHMLEQRCDGGVEFLFIDGHSTDDTRAILDELAARDPRVRVLDNPVGTVPAALNLGLREARGQYVARMDGHSWYPPDYVARGIARLERDDGVVQVTGPAIPRPHGRWSRLVAVALASPLGQGGSAKWSATVSDPDAEVELDTGVFAGVWRRSVLEGYGGWDEGWPQNQDAELAARILRDGGRIVCVAGMGALYAPRDSLAGLWHQYRNFGYYRVKTARRHPFAVRRQHLVSLALLTTAGTACVPVGRAARLARLGMAAYAAVLAVVSARARPGRAREIAGLSAVFAVLHFSWAVGFLRGCVDFGPPWRALASALAGRRDVLEDRDQLR
jgi:glycosyltransferase involved in cell wall biosynthesis